MSRRIGIIAVAALCLGGCVSLLPKTPPSQLYRFDAAAPENPGAPPQSGPGVILAEVVLPAASAGDQILTATGDQAAYIDQARWVTPAVQMLREDAERRFASGAHRVRLLHRGELTAAAALLRLDIYAFEARYDGAAGVPPTVVVSLRANLTRADGGGLQQRAFTVRQVTSQNRVSAIVAAFRDATAQALDQTVAWTDASAPEPLAPVADTTTVTSSSTSTTTSRPR